MKKIIFIFVKNVKMFLIVTLTFEHGEHFAFFDEKSA